MTLTIQNEISKAGRAKPTYRESEDFRQTACENAQNGNINSLWMTDGSLKNARIDDHSYIV